MAQITPAIGAAPRRGSPWWLAPATVVLALSGFMLYGLWSVLIAGRAEAGPYLSPFFSPRLPDIWRLSPALLVLPVPLAFRASCYHYRKAYYRSFFRHPPACARAEAAGRQYAGDSRLPYSLNHLHRFALYLSLPVLLFLWVDAGLSLVDHGRPHLGVGSLLMLLNVVLLSGYTFGCHSLRHLVGGGLDCFSAARCGRMRLGAWRRVSILTVDHGIWAWASLAGVVAVDVYIRLVQHGLADLHLGG